MRRASDSKSAIQTSCLASTCTSPQRAAAADADQAWSLRSLFPEARFFAADDIQFRDWTDAEGELQAGQLLAYRVGDADPNTIVAAALAHGAAGILTEQLLPCPLPQCIVGDVDAAIAVIESQRLGRPDRQLLNIGVVGSAGKSSTALLIATLLRNFAVRTAYQTDLGACDGVVQSTGSAPSPAGAELVRWLAEARDCDAQVAIVELDDQTIRHGQHDAVEFDLLVVTGTETCRGDFGPSALQCAIDRLVPGGVVVASADDERALRTLQDSGVSLVTYGCRRTADLTIKVIDQSGGITTSMLNYDDTTVMMESPLCGAAMAANHAAAAMVGILIDQPLAEIVAALGKLRTVPGRMQGLPGCDQADVVLDAGGSPARTAATLRAARSMQGAGRLWCVLTLDGNETAEDLARYGDLLERFADQPIVTCRGDAKAKFLTLSHAVLDGVKHCAAVRLVADQERAVRWSVAEAGPRDTIVVLGGMSQNSAAESRDTIATIQKWVDQERLSQQRQHKSPAPTTPAATTSDHGLRIVG